MSLKPFTSEDSEYVINNYLLYICDKTAMQNVQQHHFLQQGGGWKWLSLGGNFADDSAYGSEV